MKNRFLVLVSAFFLALSTSASFAGVGTIVELAAKNTDDVVEALAKRAAALGLGETALRQVTEHLNIVKPVFERSAQRELGQVDAKMAALLSKDISQLSMDDFRVILNASKTRFEATSTGSAFNACASCAAPELKSLGVVAVVKEMTPAQAAAIKAAPSDVKALHASIAKRTNYTVGDRVGSMKVGGTLGGKKIKIADLKGQAFDDLTIADKAVLHEALKKGAGEGTANEKRVMDAVVSFSDDGSGNAEILDDRLFAMVSEENWRNADGSIDSEGMQKFAELLDGGYKVKCDGACKTPDERNRALRAFFEEEAAKDPAKAAALKRLRENNCFPAIFG